MMNIRVVSIRFTKVLIFSDKTKKYSSKTLICPTHHHLDIKKARVPQLASGPIIT